jgi:hypothetical protein
MILRPSFTMTTPPSMMVSPSGETDMPQVNQPVEENKNYGR